MVTESADKVIGEFNRQYEFLSNFYFAKVVYNGVVYLNNEAAFQAQKNLGMVDKFVTLDSSEAKKLGKKVPLRDDWELVKDGVMRGVVANKFIQNPELGKKLIATGNSELIEGNWWGDRYWGVCKGSGLNMLGKILMEVRSQLVEMETNHSHVPNFERIVSVGFLANAPNNQIESKQPWLAQRVPEMLAYFGYFRSHGTTVMYYKNDTSHDWEFVFLPEDSAHEPDEAVEQADHSADLRHFFKDVKSRFGVAGIAVTDAKGIVRQLQKVSGSDE